VGCVRSDRPDLGSGSLGCIASSNTTVFQLRFQPQLHRKFDTLANIPIKSNTSIAWYMRLTASPVVGRPPGHPRRPEVRDVLPHETRLCDQARQ
jgi:hypothetical protein